MKTRQTVSGPIVPLKNGVPPNYIVGCKTCGASWDAHGRTAWDAIQSVMPNHQADHILSAREVNYSTGYGPSRTEPHPHYSG